MLPISGWPAFEFAHAYRFVMASFTRHPQRGPLPVTHTFQSKTLTRGNVCRYVVFVHKHMVATLATVLT